MGCFGSKDNSSDPGSNKPLTQSKEENKSEQPGSSNNDNNNGGSQVQEMDVLKTYAIGKTLGSGASCRVVEGFDKKDKSEKVAIKIMDKDLKQLKKLYDREVKILKQLCSNGKPKGVLDFLGYGETDDSWFIVTKLLSGGELFDRIVSKDEKYKITEKVAIGLIRSMFESLKTCHDNDIIHRDLKPENFVFANTKVESEVVLIDYGCARIVKDDDVIDDVVGTAYYLAPELACAALENYKKRGKKVSDRVPKSQPRTGKILKASDVWSMGVIAYVMMTGRAPFRGKDNAGIFESICLKPLKFPEKDARYHNTLSLNKHFMDFCKKVLVKDPNERLTIEQCLAHPWVRGIDAKDFELNKDVIHYLKQFTYQSKLKKEIIRVLAQNMTAEPTEQVRRHFNRLDVDNDGHLDLKELKLLLLDMGYTKTVAATEAEKMLAQADLNKDGVLQFDEFKAVWYRKVLSTNDQYIHRVFNVFDDNGDGYIDRKELMGVLFPEKADSEVVDNEENNENKEKDEASDGSDEAGDTALFEQLENMIAEVDENNDGKIEFEEFKNAMKEDIGKGWDVNNVNYGGFIGSKVDGMATVEEMGDKQQQFKPNVDSVEEEG